MASALSPGAYVQQGNNRSTGQATPRAVNVQVAVRCRPLNAREINSGERSVLKCIEDAREVVCSGVSAAASSKSGAGHSAGKKTYTYDHVFGPDSSQKDLYDGVVEPIVDEVLQGYNCTVFAYGQTGTGKTHTMEGRRDDDVLCMAERRLPENAGIIPRSVKQVFDHLRSIIDEHSVRVSHLELYNEQLTDLLGPDVVSASEAGAGLRVYEDNVKGTFVNGLDEVLVRSEEEIFAVLDKSANKRRTAETLMNKYSSRSHSVFTITIHIKESTPDGADLLKVGKLNLVDLAGSENVGRSGAVRGRAREAGNINQSLLTLGRVITALVEKHPHVPYRDSKLTRLLQESLGGRNKTCIIATVTPGNSSTEETFSTLDYAHRAKSIKNRPTVNQMIAKHVLLKEYTEEISKVKRELEASRAKNGIYLPPDEYERLQATGKQQKEWILTLENRMEESEKQGAALKEKLTRTQDALARTFTDLESTRSILATTENTLAVRTEELAVRSQQRDESHHLIGQHIIGETELHADGLSLTATLEQAISDVNNLHVRRDASAVVDASNGEAVESVRTNVKTQLGYINADINEFDKSLNSDLSMNREQTNKLAAGVASNAANATRALEDLCSKMRELRTTHLERVHAAERTASSDEAVDLESLKEEQAILLQQVRGIEMNLGESSVSMSKYLKAIENGLVEMEENAVSSLENQRLRIGEFANAQAELVRLVRNEFEERLTSQAGTITSAEEAVATAIKRQKAVIREAQSDALAKVASVLSAMVVSTDASGDALASVATSCTADLETSVAGMLASANAAVSEAESLESKTLGEAQEIANGARDSICTARANVTDTVSLAANTNDTSHEKCKGIVDTMVMSCEKQGQIVDAHASALSRERDSRTLLLQQVKDDDEALLLKQCSGVASGIKENASHTGAISAAVAEGISSAKTAATAFAEKLTSSLTSGVKSEVESICLLVDEDADSAPPRRDWNYPTELKTVPEHALLVAAFRHERGLRDVPLPSGLPSRVAHGATPVEPREGASEVEASGPLPPSAVDMREPSNQSAGVQDESDNDAEAMAQDESLTKAGDDFASAPAKCEASAIEADDEDMPSGSEILRDRTNLASAKPRRGVTKPAATAGIAKRSGLRPITRRAPRPARGPRN